MVVGRQSEVTDVGRFLLGSERRALLLKGPAGVGKTTVWRAAVEEASRLQHEVLVTRPLETETGASFSGLADLLGGLFDALGDTLPPPQRDALGAALLRTTPGAATAGAVSAGTLGLLRTAAREVPVLVAIDDLQWLDGPTVAALRFAFRRFDGDPVRLLATARTATPEVAVVDDGLQRLAIGPLGLESLARIVADELGHPLSRPALQRIERLAGGNAFIALELARAEAGAAPADGVLRLDEVRRLVGDRLGRLPAATRTGIATLAALGRPRVDGIAVAVGDVSVLDPAFDAGVLVESGDEIRFSHPLLAEAAVRGLPPARRRAVHARLAELADDAEERGRHLAAATLTPDDVLAAAIDRGAVDAAGRGAPAAAAELLEEAARLTTPDSRRDRCERLLRAGEHHLQSGDAGRAMVLFHRARDDDPAGALRARVLMAIANHELTSTAEGSALAQDALDACGDDAHARARVLLEAAILHLVAGDHITSAPVEEALGLLGDSPDQDLRAWALSVLGQLECFSSGGGRKAFHEAIALETAHPATAVYDRPSVWLGCAHVWADEVEPARALLTEMRATAEAIGDELSVSGIDLHLTELECRAGCLGAATTYSDEAVAIIEHQAEDRGLGACLYARSLAAAHRGDAALTRHLGERGLAIAARFEDRVFALEHHSVLGFLELSVGDCPAAVSHLEHMPAKLEAMGVGEPGVFLCHADLIEALIGVGDLAAAEARLEEWEALGRAIDRPRVLCTAARARGLLCGARGDLPAALENVERALELHDRLPVPLERGRTLLALGTIQRRAGQRRAARVSLDAAGALFGEIGAEIWADRAAAERDRISGRAARDRDELTPTERRVAELVAEGRSNREVAQELFVTVGTVESNLTRIYSKLGVRSRAQLAARRAV